MITYLHHATPIEAIKYELKSLGYNALSAVNATSMFFFAKVTLNENTFGYGLKSLGRRELSHNAFDVNSMEIPNMFATTNRDA